MEAISAIIGVAGAGAKLSILLFEFASTVGSAEQEIRQIGIEISLFCSVLKQLQSTLAKAKSYRYSLSAIETTREILDRCQQLFEEIEAIVCGLLKEVGGGLAESSVDWIGRVKWTFKLSQVQKLRTTLESCKVTLHLMLTTLEFAQKLAARRVSTTETQAEDEHESIMTRSLIIAHQCTVDTLQRLEDEEAEQPHSGVLSPPLTPGSSSMERVVRVPARQIPPRSFDNQNFHPPSPVRDSERKRASVWINGLMFDNSPLPPGFRRQTWGDTECALFLEQQPYYFLQKWTDQGEHLDQMRRLHIDQPPSQDAQSNLTDKEAAEAKPPVNSKHLETLLEPVNLLQGPRNDSKTASSPKPTAKANSPDSATANNTSVKVLPALLSKYNIEGPGGSRNLNESKTAPSPRILPEANSSASGWSRKSAESVAIFKGFRVSMEDPCYKVLPAALKKYNINAPWEQYSLYIIWGDNERCLGMNEKPLIIFKTLDKEGKKPSFMLRKIGGVI